MIKDKNKCFNKNKRQINIPTKKAITNKKKQKNKQKKQNKKNKQKKSK